jgi:hypothetical protein
VQAFGQGAGGVEIADRAGKPLAGLSYRVARSGERIDDEGVVEATSEPSAAPGHRLVDAAWGREEVTQDGRGVKVRRSPSLNPPFRYGVKAPAGNGGDKLADGAGMIKVAVLPSEGPAAGGEGAAAADRAGEVKAAGR